MDGPDDVPGIEGFSQVALSVRELPRAVGFYRDVLGLPLLFEVPGMGFFDCGGVRLLLGDETAGGTGERSALVYFRVPDIQAAYEALVQRGAKVHGEPRCVAKLADREVWLVHFDDLEGNTLALMSELATT